MKWTLLSRTILQVLQYALSVAIARVLAPEQFGAIGMIAAVTGFAALFVEFGLEAAIVQREHVTDDQLHAAFEVSLAIGGALTGAFLLGAPAVARLYGRPELTDLTRGYALTFLASSIGIVPRALLGRAMEQRRLALIDLGASVATAALTLALALTGVGVWTLVVSAVASAAAQSFGQLAFGSWRPARLVRLSAMAPLLGVGVPLLGFNVLNYWARNLDNLLIGRLIGERDLGLYMRGYSLMLLPISQVTGVLATSLIPALSRMRAERRDVSRTFLRALGAVALVTWPMMLGLAAVAGPFVRALYGERWLDLVPILRVLAVVGALQSLCNPTGWLYVSQGRTDWMMRWGLGACTTIIAALAVGAWLGSALTVACAYLVVNALLTPPCLMLPGKLVGFGLRDVARNTVPQALAAVLMAVGVLALDAWLQPTWTSGARLCAEVAAGGVAYGLLIAAIRPPSLADALELLGARELVTRQGRRVRALGNTALAELGRWRARLRSPTRQWDERARLYGVRAVLDLRHREEDVDRVTAMQRRELLPVLERALTPADRTVLDFGCGPGRFTPHLAAAVRGTAIGVDPVARFIESAPRVPGVEYRLMRGGIIPVETASVDAVWICLVLGGIRGSALHDAISEIFRVLRPGGLVFLVENTSPGAGGAFWTFRSIAEYQQLMRPAALVHCHDYDDLGERMSVLCGRTPASGIRH